MPPMEVKESIVFEVFALELWNVSNIQIWELNPIVQVCSRASESTQEA